MNNDIQLCNDVKRLVDQHTHSLCFSKLLELLVVIRQWKAALSSSDFATAMRHKQVIARLINAIIELQSSLPNEIARLFYQLIELERLNIQDFEDYIAALNEHKISSLISQLYLTTNRRKNDY